MKVLQGLHYLPAYTIAKTEEDETGSCQDEGTTWLIRRLLLHNNCDTVFLILSWSHLQPCEERIKHTKYNDDSRALPFHQVSSFEGWMDNLTCRGLLFCISTSPAERSREWGSSFFMSKGRRMMIESQSRSIYVVSQFSSSSLPVPRDSNISSTGSRSPTCKCKHRKVMKCLQEKNHTTSP